MDPWRVYPSLDERDGQDLISFGNRPAGSLLWLRELRYPALCRTRMTDGLNAGIYQVWPARRVWSAVERNAGDDRVWTISHNGAELGELRWSASYAVTHPHPTDGLLYGLNMLAPGRHPFCCEPMPLTRPHLRLVR